MKSPLAHYVNSLAIISDGLHALLDAFSSVMLYFAVRASLKPADEEHTYGHEKFETIGGLIAGIVLIAVAFLIFYEAITRLIAGVALEGGGVEYAGFIAIAYALAISMLRVTVFKKGEKSESQSMKAGFYDAIADLGSTLNRPTRLRLSINRIRRRRCIRLNLPRLHANLPEPKTCAGKHQRIK